MSEPVSIAVDQVLACWAAGRQHTLDIALSDDAQRVFLLLTRRAEEAGAAEFVIEADALVDALDPAVEQGSRFARAEAAVREIMAATVTFASSESVSVSSLATAASWSSETSSTHNLEVHLASTLLPALERRTPPA